jgi:hypothetical protein
VIQLVIARLDRAIQYAAAEVVNSNRKHGVLDASPEAGHDGGGLGYLVTCADTASHLPFCLAQQSV